MQPCETGVRQGKVLALQDYHQAQSLIRLGNVPF